MLIGQVFELSVFALNILTATGLAVGIDYSLFIVSRYREERRSGLEKMPAIAAASATASNAVFFSGMTVILALVGMLIVPLSIFVSLGVGAMSAVFAAVTAALTLLPAILSLLGDKVDALKVPWLDRYGRSHGEHGWWGRMARRVMRRPAVSLILGVILLLAIAAPALTMRSGGLSAATFPDTYTSKQGLDMLQRDFAAGMSEPTTVVIDGDIGDAKVQQGLKDFVAKVKEDGRFTVIGLSTSADGSLAVLQMVQDADAMSEKAKAAVRDLRSTLVPEAFAGTGATVYVGGNTAAQIDSTDLTGHYMPIVIGVVLALSFLLLLLAFRSVIVSATAIVMNLLSVGAAYGALTLVFQHGWGADVVGLTKVEAIESWVPLLMFCVLFGLSMDYQVFLLSRIRERWYETRESRESVVFGVQSTAGIITGAALIMVAVFLGMGSGRMVVLQELGFGLAIAVLLDAFVVRVIVAPAMISLIGDRYWWMPRWLEWLPRIDIEGKTQPDERLRRRAQGAAAGDEGAAAAGDGARSATPAHAPAPRLRAGERDMSDAGRRRRAPGRAGRTARRPARAHPGRDPRRRGRAGQRARRRRPEPAGTGDAGRVRQRRVALPVLREQAGHRGRARLPRPRAPGRLHAPRAGGPAAGGADHRDLHDLPRVRPGEPGGAARAAQRRPAARRRTSAPPPCRTSSCGACSGWARRRARAAPWTSRTRATSSWSCTPSGRSRTAWPSTTRCTRIPSVNCCAAGTATCSAPASRASAATGAPEQSSTSSARHAAKDAKGARRQACRRAPFAWS